MVTFSAGKTGDSAAPGHTRGGSGGGGESPPDQKDERVRPKAAKSPACDCSAFV